MGFWKNLVIEQEVFDKVNGPKMLRETLCIAQVGLSDRVYDRRREEHMKRIQVLIDICDKHRPLGPNGKHGNLHTETCGCEDK